MLGRIESISPHGNLHIVLDIAIDLGGGYTEKTSHGIILKSSDCLTKMSIDQIQKLKERRDKAVTMAELERIAEDEMTATAIEAHWEMQRERVVCKSNAARRF